MNEENHLGLLLSLQLDSTTELLPFRTAWPRYEVDFSLVHAAYSCDIPILLGSRIRRCV